MKLEITKTRRLDLVLIWWQYKDGGNGIDEAKLGQALCQEAVGENAPAIAAYKELTNSPNAVIKVRASALLEAIQTTLEPLPSTRTG